MLDNAETLKQDAVNLLETFVAKGPFSSEWTATDALGYIADMKNQLKMLRQREEQLRKDLGVFELSLLESQEMQRLEKVSNYCEILSGLFRP